MNANKNTREKLVTRVLVALLGLMMLTVGTGCDTLYDPYWDINSVARYRQAETDFWANMWDDEILNY